jgi:hypothetical protein
MSENIGNKLPPPLRFDLGEKVTGEICRAVLLITVDAEGSPRVAVLSPGEVKALDERRLGIEVHGQTTTAKNLGRGSSALLWCVLDAAAYSMRGTPSPAKPSAQGYAAFEITLNDVLKDFQAGSPMVAGPTYKNLGSDRG